MPLAAIMAFKMYDVGPAGDHMHNVAAVLFDSANSWSEKCFALV